MINRNEDVQTKALLHSGVWPECTLPIVVESISLKDYFFQQHRGKNSSKTCFHTDLKNFFCIHLKSRKFTGANVAGGKIRPLDKHIWKLLDIREAE